MRDSVVTGGGCEGKVRNFRRGVRVESQLVDREVVRGGVDEVIGRWGLPWRREEGGVWGARSLYGGGPERELRTRLSRRRGARSARILETAG